MWLRPFDCAPRQLVRSGEWARRGLQEAAAVVDLVEDILHSLLLGPAWASGRRVPIVTGAWRIATQ